jgi:uncharacterized membrane protein
MRTFKIVMKYLLALLFVLAGANHFRDPEFYMRMMPPPLPWHSALHLIAGVFEMLFGVMLLVPKYQRLAAWGLISRRDGIIPAPYAARYHWVAVLAPGALSQAEVKRLIKDSYEMVKAKLPKKTRAQLG